MKDTMEDIKARHEAEIAKEAAELAAEAAEIAAKTKLQSTKQGLKENISKDMNKVNTMSQQAENSLDSFAGETKDKLKDGLSESLYKLAEKASRLADKINK